MKSPQTASTCFALACAILASLATGCRPALDLRLDSEAAVAGPDPFVSPTPVESPSPLHQPRPAPAGWLSTSGNKIMLDGKVWMGKGANILDLRSNEACDDPYYPSDADFSERVAELEKKIDVLVDQWGANFIRLTMESYGPSESLVKDAAYEAALVKVVSYIGTKPGVYVEISPWIEPSKLVLSPASWDVGNLALGIPSIAPALLGAAANPGTPIDSSADYFTSDVILKLVDDFHASKQVIFGLTNEPTDNDLTDGSNDAAVWKQLNTMAQLIRDREAKLGSSQHLIAVQGTRDWAKDLGYYVAHPITAGGGEDVVYETHAYEHASEFEKRIVEPANTLPVIIGEFGPADTGAGPVMSIAESQQLMKLAEEHQIPFAAWSFNPKGFPSLIEDTTVDGCFIDWSGAGAVPTAWGEAVKAELQAESTR